MKQMKLSLAVAMSLALAGCSNSPEKSNDIGMFTLLKEQLSTLRAKDSEDQLGGVGASEIAQVLAARPDPLALVAVERTRGQALFLRIATNGPYGTYGTANRLSVVFRNGIITATRGLGGDLMASRTDELERALASRSRTLAPYTLEFLDGEDYTVTIKATCALEPSGQTRVSGGEVDVVATQVVAECAAPDGTSFTDTFMVGPDGRVVALRQWMGSHIGYVSAQHLRQ